MATIGAYLQVSKFGDALGVELEEVWYGHEPVLFAAEPPSSTASQHHLEQFLSQSPAPEGGRHACNRDHRSTDRRPRGGLRPGEEHFGQVPNFVKVLASNPTFCTSITDFVIQALGEGRVNWAFKELVILKTLRATGVYDGYGAHERLALELGNDPGWIGDLNNSLWVDSGRFDAAEKAVFAVIEQIAEDANDVGDELWAPLLEHWDTGQLLELAAVITTFLNIGRMFDTLGVSDPVQFTKPVA